jgi:hypothetical protein
MITHHFIDECIYPRLLLLDIVVISIQLLKYLVCKSKCKDQSVKYRCLAPRDSIIFHFDFLTLHLVYNHITTAPQGFSKPVFPKKEGTLRPVSSMHVVTIIVIKGTG